MNETAEAELPKEKPITRRGSRKEVLERQETLGDFKRRGPGTSLDHVQKGIWEGEAVRNSGDRLSWMMKLYL